MTDWIDMKPWWSQLSATAEQRDVQKRPFASTRDWNPKSHLYGLIGEQAFAIMTGRAVNLELIIDGDGGADFKGIDVKATKYWSDPWLKHPADADIGVDYFVLAAIDDKKQRARIVGYVTADDMRSAEIKDWGHGPQRSIPPAKVRTDLSRFNVGSSVITLEESHIEFADKVGNMRHNPEARPAALKSHILDARCQAAAKLFLNPVKWNTGANRAADFETWINIISIDDLWRSLIVKPSAKDDHAYLLVSAAQHPRYHIIGWMWGRDAKLEKYWLDPAEGQGAFYVKQDDLYPPETLVDKLRLRQVYDRELQLQKTREIAFEHNCHCGKWGPFGYGVSMLKDRKGEWFCREHRPQTKAA